MGKVARDPGCEEPGPVPEWGLPGDPPNPLPFADSRRRPWEGKPLASLKTWRTACLEVPAS